MPNHELNLKVEILMMLLRNIDHFVGLCNGTRLIVTRFGNHVLEDKILSGNNALRTQGLHSNDVIDSIGFKIAI